ncbi:response regulator transcription factor [Actinoplanes sp. NBC_00393]|uniref:response regulator transcription factor n=1 Tax=Actinoplanes sp. NBC_00393 TaxID=2975953 RepID=UPI002E1FD786
MRPLRVLVADAAPLQRSGLRAMLTTPATAGEPSAPEWASDGTAPAEIVVAGEAGDGVEAVELARRLLPDVLITDLTLPRADGFAVTRAVAQANLPVHVLVLTARDSDDEVLAAVSAGVTGYLCKDAPREELVAAVRAVAAGGAVIAPPLLARILGRVAEAVPVTTDNGAARLDALTGREREVLVHVARGRTNAEIADLLQVSETTVKTHVGHVLTKLRLRDRTQAVVLAYETGLVKPGA